MKSVRIVFVGIFALLLLSATHTIAVVDQRLEIQGTNLVLSWPSPGGYQEYMIQYRQTLDPSTPWVQLTNNYFANSSTRTTFTIYGVVPPPSTNSTGGGGSYGPPPSPMSAGLAQPTKPMATRADGTGPVVPLALYPPGFDLSRFLIYDPAVSDWVSGATYVRPSLSAMTLNDPTPQDDPQDGPGSDAPVVSSGFYRVWHVPDWAFNVTDYTYDGSWFFPIDFADYRERVDRVELLINGEPTPYAEYMPYVSGGHTNWGLGIDFDRLANGTYQIQLVTTLALNDETEDNAVLLVLSNKVQSIVVFNEVTFPDWNDFMQGNTYTFKAQLANPNTDWTIDIYDVHGEYVNSGSGHTYNGQVEWAWNLYDWMGNNRDNFDNDPYFYSYITFDSSAGVARAAGNGPEGASTTKSTPVPVKGYPNVGEWLIAFQDRWFSDGWGYPSDLQGYYEDALNEIWGGPILVGDNAWWQPLKFGTNYTQMEREQTWANLLAGIGDLNVRNFYYHGHGGANSIGCDMHTFSTNGLITGGTFSYRGSRSVMESWQIASKTKYNRYRFVYLDGCSTAVGNLPNAFNISKTNHTIDFYEGNPKHPRPSVFVGWNQTVGGDGWGSAYKRLDFQSYWMGDWANDFDDPDIETALDRANTGANWVSSSKLWGALTIYGYKQMRMEDYNSKGDWRWP